MEHQIYSIKMDSTVFEVLMIFFLILLIAAFALLKRGSTRKEERKAREERKKRMDEKEKRLSALSEDEKRATYAVAMKERTAFLKRIESEYTIFFHPFSDFEYKASDPYSNQLITRSIGYYTLPKGTRKIAAFFFEGDLEYDKLNSITLNINGMVNRRFEGFSEYMEARTFDVKEGDLITIEIEFDENKDFSLKNFGILVLEDRK